MVDKTQRGRPHQGSSPLDRLASETGQTVLEVIKGAISTQKSLNKAARFLKVSPNAVRYHLRKARLTFRVYMVVEFIPLGSGEEGGISQE
jgi:hypothetical protein